LAIAVAYPYRNPAASFEWPRDEAAIRRFELEVQVRKFPLKPLEFTEMPAELTPNRGVLPRQIEGELAKRERTRRIAQTLDVEARDQVLEPAGAEQQVILRNAAIVEEERTPVLAVHERTRRADFETRALRSTRTAPIRRRPARSGHRPGTPTHGAVGREDLVPMMTMLSPSTFAWVVSSVTAEPAWGSLMHS